MRQYAHKLEQQLRAIRLARAKARHNKLPRDPEGMNKRRSDSAETALLAFMQDTGVDLEDALADLLANLRHFADRHGFDWDAELERANEHYQTETYRTKKGKAA